MARASGLRVGIVRVVLKYFLREVAISVLTGSSLE